jgi:hypothetical protein
MDGLVGKARDCTGGRWKENEIGSEQGKASTDTIPKEASVI